MLSNQSELEELRRRIDGIDNNLLGLLADRLAVVAQVAALKANGRDANYVPSREAAIIRRLVERSRSGLPVGTVVRMWRELLGTAVRSEGPFAVGAYVPADRPGVWDLSRDHFGSQTPMTVYQTTLQVIRAVTDGRVSVGVLPMPQDGDSDPWWVHLLSSDSDVPRVVARLPFGPRGNARSDGDALAIGYGPQAPSGGADRTLLATENAVDISHSRFVSVLTGLGLNCTFLASGGPREPGYTLIEVDGFVTLDDARLDELRGRFGADLYRLLAVGSYAVPLPEAANPPAASGLAQPIGMPAPAGHGTRS
jgi:chorismate mutase / prephenate dehydratase